MAYVDASIVLRHVLSQPGAIASPAELHPGVVSEIAQLECMRALDRMRLAGTLPEEHLA